jgi:hypothetical protein
MKYYALLALLLSACAEQEEQSNREIPLPQSAFRASISLESYPKSLMRNQSVDVPVVIRNLGDEKWPSLTYIGGKYVVAAAYAILDTNQKVIKEGNRTMLKHDLWPDEQMSLDVHVQAPDIPGKYKIVIALVQEGVAWFNYYDPTLGSSAAFVVTVL